MKRKAEIRFCALGFLCLVVIVVAAMTLSETAKGIHLTEGNSGEGNSQTELVTATETQIDNLLAKIYEGRATRKDITRVTRRLGDEIAAVYGWPIRRCKKSGAKT